METTYSSFYDFMKSYDIETLQAITEQGCINGVAGGLIYYSETNDLYDQFAHELHEQLGKWIDEIGETPDFITKELGFCSGFKNAMVWFVAEQYANNIIQTLECENTSC